MQIVAAVRLASRLAREHACTPQLNPDASAEKSLKPLSGLIPVPSGLSPSLLTLSDSCVRPGVAEPDCEPVEG